MTVGMLRKAPQDATAAQRPKVALWMLVIGFHLLQMCWWDIYYLSNAQGSSAHTYTMLRCINGRKTDDLGSFESFQTIFARNLTQYRVFFRTFAANFSNTPP